MANTEGVRTATVTGTIRSMSDGKTFVVPDEYECDVVTMGGAEPLLEDSRGNVLACNNGFGMGNVIISTVNWMVPKDDSSGKGGDCLVRMVYGKTFPFVEYFLKQFVSETLPIGVEGDVQYGMNRLSDGWIVYLINNKGVTKFTNKAQRLDISKTAEVEIFLRNIKAETITELRGKNAVQTIRGSNSFTIKVPPGDIRIVRIEEGR